MKKLIVGIVARADLSPSGNKISIIYDAIRTKISSLGCIPLGILPVSTNSYTNFLIGDLDKEAFKETLTLCDGFIFQGGDNNYDYDFEVIKYAYDLNIPLLGICQGMQGIGEFLGGKLCLIPTPHIHHSKKEYVHDIEIKKNSKLYEIIGKDKIIVNSFHNEQIIDISEKYVSARCENIIEAIEADSKRFFIGMQWHPEKLEDEFTNKIFEAFKKAMKEGIIK